MRFWGWLLVVVSSAVWCGLFFVHLLPLSWAGKTAAYTVIFIAAEVGFWGGCVMVGAGWALRRWEAVKERLARRSAGNPLPPP